MIVYLNTIIMLPSALPRRPADPHSQRGAECRRREKTRGRRAPLARRGGCSRAVFAQQGGWGGSGAIGQEPERAASAGSSVKRPLPTSL